MHPPHESPPPRPDDRVQGRSSILNSVLSREADDLSQELIAKIVAEAGGDDRALLRLLADNSEVTKRHQDRLIAARDDAARRLRDAGVPMIDIAEDAGVTDSYLSRRVIKNGATRILDRTKPRRRRRPS